MSSMFGMSVFICVGCLGGGYIGCVHEDDRAGMSTLV